jgi:hypothetical protein
VTSQRTVSLIFKGRGHFKRGFGEKYLDKRRVDEKITRA